jgi:hypothetical protein
MLNLVVRRETARLLKVKILQFCMVLEVFLAVIIKNAAVLYMMPSSLLKIYQHFRGTCYLNMQGRGFLEVESSSFL